MPDQQFLYPATPTNVPESVTKVSPAFRKKVSGVMASIVGFFIVYLLMFILSIGLIVACFYGGIALIIAAPRIITIVIGIGLMGLGVMVFIFLIKFLFAVSKYDKSNSIEISENDQPQLFAFIRQLTNDVQTPFPKKIYLSPDVNAAVFYNSGFWSMFLPIRKNLVIGLGLINSLNISEFKAVMAHEFGHFSQRSMKLGSFVYNVNRIIYNMLFDNSGYGGFLQSWANVDGIFAIFAQITAKVAQGIQWVLRKMYALVNKSYMSLSREMEFHADAVAASVSGSQSLVSALRRIELANAGYNIALQKCDELFRQKKISNNIYHNHKTVLKHLANEFNLHMDGDIPVVNEKFIAESNTSRVNFKDQWASHPSTDDRAKHLNDLAVVAELNSEPAWLLFDNREDLELQLTNKVYEHTTKDKDVVAIQNVEFEQKLTEDINQFTLPSVYNGFYDSRQVAIVNVKELSVADNSSDSISKIFSDEHAALPKKLKALSDDLEIVKAIADNRIQAKTFDFDGKKYKRNDAAIVIALLEEEQKRIKEQLEEADKNAIRFFLSKARLMSAAEKENLEKLYSGYFEQRKNADEFLGVINKTMESLQPIFSGQTIQISQISIMINDLKADHEIKLKGWLKRWLALNVYENKPEEKEKVEKFINSNYAYFGGSTFMDNELIMLNEVCNDSWKAVNTFLFGKFKSMLEMQLKVLKETCNSLNID